MRTLAVKLHFVSYLEVLLKHVLRYDQRALRLVAEFFNWQALSTWVS